MKQKIVFFLRTNDSIDPLFIYLSHALLKKSINLIPTNIIDLQKNLSINKTTVLSINNTIFSNKIYKDLYKKHITFLISNERINLIEVSSFDPLIQFNKSKLKSNLKEIYHYLELPDTLENITIYIAQHFTGQKEVNRWKWGTRSALPMI